jgi:hypothetical protein
MARSRKTPKGQTGIRSAEFSVDPLLVGADREFAGRFPPGLLSQCGLVPLRLYRDVGLVVPHSRATTPKAFDRAKKAAGVRLVSVPAIHDFGVELFLRYMESGDENAPPLWIPESRRAYLNRLGDFRDPKPALLIASIILSSPLAANYPTLACLLGGEGHVLYLHGTSGLKSGIRFPGARLGEVLARLKLEFGMDGRSRGEELWVEGRGLEDRGLEDLTALHLPLEGEAFVIEPRGARR